MDETAILGIGCTVPVRRSTRDAEELALEAIGLALADARLAPQEVEAVVTESTLCPVAAPLDRVAPAAGFNSLKRKAHSTPVGAGIFAALGMASDMVARGEVETAVTYFTTGWGSATAGPTDYHAKMEAKHLIEDPVGFSGPPLYFAVAAKRYQHLHGMSDADMEAMLFDISSSARANATLHPHAQVRQPLDGAGYAASPMIAEPLRQADCSLLTDGAVAIVVGKKERLAAGQPHVRVKSWAYAVDPIPDADFYTQSPFLPDLPAAGRASAEAFDKAELERRDIDVLGIYDCFSIAVAMQLEAAGFCAAGGTRMLIAQGGLRHDGRLPTNTHGGLSAHGYLLGAAHLVELVEQLRGSAGARQVKDARYGFAGAGPGRQYCAIILEKVAA